MTSSPRWGGVSHRRSYGRGRPLTRRIVGASGAFWRCVTVLATRIGNQCPVPQWARPPPERHAWRFEDLILVRRNATFE